MCTLSFYHLRCLRVEVKLSALRPSHKLLSSMKVKVINI